jgi:hypothetical protein
MVNGPVRLSLASELANGEEAATAALALDDDRGIYGDD